MEAKDVFTLLKKSSIIKPNRRLNRSMDTILSEWVAGENP